MGETDWGGNWALLWWVGQCSVQFSHSVVSDSLWSHDCSTPGFPVHHQLLGAYSNSHPSSQWCHPTISPSVIPFSSCLRSFPASGSFSMSWLFASGGQRIGASSSASALPTNIQGWFPLGLTVLISFCPRDFLRVFSNTTVQKHQLLDTQPSIKNVQLSHPYMTAVKTIALIIWTIVSKAMSLLFNSMSSFFIAFLSKNKHHLISRLQS